MFVFRFIMENKTSGEKGQSSFDDDALSQQQSSFETRVLQMLGHLSDDMQSMGERLCDLEGRQTSTDVDAASIASIAEGEAHGSTTCTGTKPAQSAKGKGPSPLAIASSDETDPNLWANRDEESMDYNFEVHFDDEEEDSIEAKGVKLFKVSEKTEKFLNNAFSSGSANTIRRQWRDKYGAPQTTATACPSLDKVIKSRLPAVTKSRDRQLAKQQALMLDAVGPLLIYWRKWPKAS